MKPRSRTRRRGSAGVVAAVLLCAACFEEAPPVRDASTGGSTTDAVTGSSTAPATSTGGPATSSPDSGATLDGTGNTDAGSLDAESTTAAEMPCGNTVVDDGEMCDGTPGCDTTCRFTDYACNPLNDAGCEPPLRCGLFDFATETFACMPAGPIGVGGTCGVSTANDGDCDASLTCIFNTQTVLCDEGNCCVRYCDLVAGTGCEAFERCAQFFPMPTFVGLEHLGYCLSG